MSASTFLRQGRAAVLAAWLATMGAVAVSAADNDQARADWMAAYRKLEAAEKIEGRRDYAQAFELYSQARLMFEQVQRQFPRWNPSILQYRIAYCDKKLARLQQAADQGRSDAPTRGPDPATAALMRDAKLAIMKLQTQVARLNQALDQAQAEAARNSQALHDVERLTTENQALRESDDGLRHQMKALAAQIVELKEKGGVEAALLDLRKERELIELKRQEYERQRTELEQELAKWRDTCKRLSLEREQALLSLRQCEGKQVGVERQRQQWEEALAGERRRVEDLRLQLQTAEEARDAGQTRAAELKQSLAKSETRLTDLQQEYEKRLTEVAQLPVLRDRARALEATGKEAQAALTTARRRARQLDARVVELEQQLQARTATENAAQEALTAARRRAREQDARVVELEQQLQARTATGRAAPSAAEDQLRQALATEKQKRQEAEAKLAVALSDNDRKPRPNQQPAPAPAGRDATPEAPQPSAEMLAQLRHDVAALNGKLEAAAAARQAAGEAASAARQRVREIAEELAAQAKRQEQSTQDLAAAQQRERTARDEARGAVARSLAEQDGLRKELAAARGRAREQDERLTAQAHNLDVLQEANQELREQLQAAQARLRRRDEAGASAETELKELRGKVAALTKAEQQWRTKYDAQLALSRAFRSEVEDLKAERNAVTPPPPEPEKETVAGYRATIRELEAKLKDAQARAASQEVALLKEREAVETARRDLAAMGGAATGARPPEGTDDEVALLKKHVLKLVKDLEGERRKNARLRAQAGSTPTAAEEGLSDQAIDRQAQVKILLHQATTAEQQKNPEAAKWNYQRVLELDPQEPVALVRLGNLLTDAGDFENAKRYLMRAFYDNPDNMDVLMPLGFLLAHQNEADMAVSMLSRAVALYPDNPDFHRFLGIACRSLGWREAAEVQFRRSYKLDKNSAETAFNLAVVCVSDQPPRLDEARTWYHRARELGAESDPGLERLIAPP